MADSGFGAAEKIVEGMKVLGALDPVYEALMSDIAHMKDDLPMLSSTLASARKEVRELVDALKVRESQILSALNFKTLGSNDTERKSKLPALLDDDGQYKALKRRLHNAQYNLDAAEEEYGSARRVLNGVGYAAQLQAAYIIAMSAVTVPLPAPAVEDIDDNATDEILGL